MLQDISIKLLKNLVTLLKDLDNSITDVVFDFKNYRVRIYHITDCITQYNYTTWENIIDDEDVVIRDDATCETLILSKCFDKKYTEKDLVCELVEYVCSDADDRTGEEEAIFL